MTIQKGEKLSRDIKCSRLKGGDVERAHLFSVVCGTSQRPFRSLSICSVVARQCFRRLGSPYRFQVCSTSKSDVHRKLCDADGTTLPFLVKKAQWVLAKELSVPALKITPQQILFGTSLCLPRSSPELCYVLWILHNCPEHCPYTDDSDGWGSVSFLSIAFCF